LHEKKGPIRVGEQAIFVAKRQAEGAVINANVTKRQKGRDETAGRLYGEGTSVTNINRVLN